MKSNNNAKPSRKTIFTCLNHHDMEGEVCNFRNKLLQNKNIKELNIEELENPNHSDDENSDNKPDIILISGHGRVENTHEIYFSEKVRSTTAIIIKDIADKSKDDASFIISACFGTKSAIDILHKKSLKNGQSAIILGGTNKSIIYLRDLNKQIKTLSIIAEHEGKVSDELINKLKDYYPTTFSAIQNSKLTKYSRLKYDSDSKEFYRDISVFDKKKENGGAWTGKRREYIKTPNIDLLLGFVSGTFVEIKQEKSSKDTDDKIDQILETLEAVVNTLRNDVSSDNKLILNEAIIYSLLCCAINIFNNKNKTYPIKIFSGVVEILSKQDYTILSKELLGSVENIFLELIQKVESSKNPQLPLDRLKDKLIEVRQAKKSTFAAKNKKSPLFEYRNSGRVFVSDPSSDDIKDMMRHFYLAKSQFNRGEFENGYTSLINSLKNCPTSDQRRIEQIIDLFDDHDEKKNSNHCDAFGEALLNHGKYQEAEKYFQLADDKRPKNDEKKPALKLPRKTQAKTPKSPAPKVVPTNKYDEGRDHYYNKETKEAYASFKEYLQLGDKTYRNKALNKLVQLSAIDPDLITLKEAKRFFDAIDKNAREESTIVYMMHKYSLKIEELKKYENKDYQDQIHDQACALIKEALTDLNLKESLSLMKGINQIKVCQTLIEWSSIEPNLISLKEAQQYFEVVTQGVKKLEDVKDIKKVKEVKSLAYLLIRYTTEMEVAEEEEGNDDLLLNLARCAKEESMKVDWNKDKDSEYKDIVSDCLESIKKLEEDLLNKQSPAGSNNAKNSTENLTENPTKKPTEDPSKNPSKKPNNSINPQNAQKVNNQNQKQPKQP